MKPRGGKKWSMNHYGFTLIEMIIYLAILAVMIVFAVMVFYQVISSHEQNRSRAEVEGEAHFLMRKIIWGVRGAAAIGSPPAGATSSALSITKPNFSGNPLTFSLATGTAFLARASGAPVPLTSSNVFVKELTFTHVLGTPTRAAGVGIHLMLASRLEQDVIVASTTLNNTLYLR